MRIEEAATFVQSKYHLGQVNNRLNSGLQVDRMEKRSYFNFLRATI